MSQFLLDSAYKKLNLSRYPCPWWFLWQPFHLPLPFLIAHPAYLPQLPQTSHSSYDLAPSLSGGRNMLSSQWGSHARWQRSYWNSGPGSGKNHQKMPSIGLHPHVQQFLVLPDHRTTQQGQSHAPLASLQSYPTGFLNMMAVLIGHWVCYNRHAGGRRSGMIPRGTIDAMSIVTRACEGFHCAERVLHH